MIKEIIAMGKDVVEAKENAKIALGAGPLDDVQFEILHAGSKGIFGIIGVKKAQVKAWIELPDTQERKPKAPRKEAKPEAEASAKTEENVNNNSQERPERKKNHKKKKKPQQKPQQPKKPAEKAPKAPKAQAIPEEELKMELRVVEDGDDMSTISLRLLSLRSDLMQRQSSTQLRTAHAESLSKATMQQFLSATTVTLSMLSSILQTLHPQERTRRVSATRAALPLISRATERRERKLSARSLAEWRQRLSVTREALCSSL